MNLQHLRFGIELKKRRKLLGKTLKDIENETGMRETYFSMLEKGGIGNPRRETLQKIASAYKVSEKKVEEAFTTDPKEEEKIVKMESILKQIVNDEKLTPAIKNTVKKAMRDGLSLSGTRAIIMLYASHYKKKLL